jgi:sugar/nucleoside kinase (ribokinase family)
MSNEGGIVCGGTICTDYVVMVDQWPSENSLSNIHNEMKTGGGGPFNILKDLRSMDENLSLSIVGLLGNDANGQWLIDDCQKSNIDTNQLHITKDKTPTSYTYVITVESTGRRTFFNQRGTNALLTDIHFDFNYLVKEKKYNLFYLGYVTILNQLDCIIDNETIVGKVLKQAKDYGLETIVDFVSAENLLYSKIAQLTLPYVDHLIINEIEAGLIVNQTLQQGTIRDVEQVARILIEQYHVQRTVTIHFERGAICISRENDQSLECFRQGSLCLPNGFIKAAVGAGDAFAAGFIYGIYKKWPIQERLTCGVCVAAMCLTDETPHGGVRSIEECMKLKDIFSFRRLEETSSVNDIQQ